MLNTMSTWAGAGVILPHGNQVYMVRVRRRRMIRWELPSGIVQPGEQLEDTAFRCIFEDSGGKILIQVHQPICIYLHESMQLQRTFFGMFFLGSLNNSLGAVSEPLSIGLTEEVIPSDARQQIVSNGFVEWEKISEREIHPLHRYLLQLWNEHQRPEPFFVSGQADAEIPFYFGQAGYDSLQHISR